MNKEVSQSWMKFLNPEALRGNLILTGLFIATYETLKESIIEQLRDFYFDDFDEAGKTVVSESYASKVLSLDSKKNPMRASIRWLKNSGAIDEDDEKLINELREYRNQIAHDLPKFLAESGHDVDVSKFGQILDLVTKIDRWWIINVELAIRDDVKLSDVNEEKILSGRMMFLELMLGIVTGTKHTDLHKEFLAKLAEKSGGELK